jgi:hypothetical protein
MLPKAIPVEVKDIRLPFFSAVAAFGILSVAIQYISVQLGLVTWMCRVQGTGIGTIMLHVVTLLHTTYRRYICSSHVMMCTTDLIENGYMESFSRKGGATTVR